MIATPKKYKISIDALELECIIGILDFERTTPQKISIDISLSYTLDENFLDYAEIREKIRELFIKKRFFLLEDALQSSLNLIKEEFPVVESCSMKISKPQIFSDCCVSVESSFEATTCSCS